MKHNFMNKENGKIASVLVMYLDDDGHMQTDSYDKVEDLMADYGAYEPAKPEPLIKNEKIRKAVRAWAEATRTTSISYWGGELESEQNDSKIEFDNIAVVEFGDNYTIAELCGEEEE